MHENLTLSDIYHPEFLKFHEFNIYNAFVLSNIVFFPCLYIVWTQSKSAKMYKYLLINQLCWSYLHDIVFTVWIHCPIFPISAIFFRGLSTYFGGNAFKYHLPLHLLVSVGHTQSYLIAGLYRLSYASGNPTTIIQHWFRSGQRLTILIFGSWIIFSIPVAGPSIIGDYEVWKHSQLPNEPLLQEMLKIEPTVSGYPFFGFKNASPTLAVSLMAYAIFIFVFFIGGSAIYGWFIYDSFIGMKKFMSKQTYKIHMILFWAITVQLITVTILLFLPFAVQYTVFLLQVRSGSIIAMSMFLSMNYHLFVEIIALGFFVKPYREYLVSLWKNGTRKLRNESEGNSRANIHSATSKSTSSTNDQPDSSTIKTKKSNVS